MDKYTIALCYDFDGTLSPDNMQEYSFIPKLQKEPREFWEQAQKVATEADADEILAYMYLMCSEAQKNNIMVRHEDFSNFGKGIQLFKGLTPDDKGIDWFKDIGEYANTYGAEVKHYIISSGIKEMIEGTSIASKFDKIYASSFKYNMYGAAEWPALAVNYTGKMQFLFRINKGILDIQQTINNYMPESERPVPFKRMIYFGDGTTDIPAMKLVRTQGGYSIAVHDGTDEKKNCSKMLLEEERVNFVARADYSQNSVLTKQVKRVIDKICAVHAIEMGEKRHSIK